MAKWMKVAEVIQIGLIGCGGIGRTLAQAVTATGMGRIRNVFDLDPTRSLALAQVYGAEVSTSEEALQANQDLQAVIIAVPPFLHRESALKAVQAGKHIFLEKPMALSSNACREINEAVRKAGLSLMVGHVLRYFEPFQTITRWVREGQLGRPLHGDIWRIEREYLQLARWKGQRALSGGYLYEVGAHELDWMRCLFGEAQAVHTVVQKEWPAEHEIEDLVSVQIQFDSGAVSTFLGGAGFPSTEYGFCLRFESATIRSADAFAPSTLKVEWMDSGRPEPGDLVFAVENPFEAEMRDWLGSLMSGSRAPITGEDAGKTVALIEAAYESTEWGRDPRRMDHGQTETYG